MVAIPRAAQNATLIVTGRLNGEVRSGWLTVWDGGTGTTSRLDGTTLLRVNAGEVRLSVRWDAAPDGRQPFDSGVTLLLRENDVQDVNFTLDLPALPKPRTYRVLDAFVASQFASFVGQDGKVTIQQAAPLLKPTLQLGASIYLTVVEGEGREVPADVMHDEVFVLPGWEYVDETASAPGEKHPVTGLQRRFVSWVGGGVSETNVTHGFSRARPLREAVEVTRAQYVAAAAEFGVGVILPDVPHRYFRVAVRRWVIDAFPNGAEQLGGLNLGMVQGGPTNDFLLRPVPERLRLRLFDLSVPGRFDPVTMRSTLGVKVEWAPETTTAHFDVLLDPSQGLAQEVEIRHASTRSLEGVNLSQVPSSAFDLDMVATNPLFGQEQTTKARPQVPTNTAYARIRLNGPLRATVRLLMPAGFNALEVKAVENGKPFVRPRSVAGTFAPGRENPVLVILP